MKTPPPDLAVPVPPNAARFVAIALIGPALLVAMAAGLDHQYSTSETLRNAARVAYERRAVAAALIPRIVDAESGQRGFVITGDDRFLSHYAVARASVFAGLTELDRDLRSEPGQQRRLHALRSLAVRKFAEMDSVIAVRRAEGADAASQRVARGEGAALTERMRAISGAIVRAAGVTRDRRVAAFSRGTDANLKTIWLGIVAVGLISLGTAFAFWRQSMARYAARRETYEAAERNRTILDSTLDAIAILDLDGRIETINRAASRLLGYAADDLVGRDVSALVHAAQRHAPFLERLGYVDGQLRQPYRSDRTILHRDGHEVTVDVALGMIDLPDGVHVVVSARDSSERKRIERMKDALMSTVSHELRTPLTSVVGALGLLRAGSAGVIPEPAARLIAIAENNSRRLIRLINDMLDIDRIQSGALRLARAPIDLVDVVDRAAVGSQGLAAVESVQIACDLPGQAVIVLGDPDRLLQVITNLVSNAVRASPTGGIVQIGLRVVDASGKVMVTVDDQGAGVPPAFRDRIFGRFERADGEQGVGTGLGLAISREIIARHDGQIWFEDRPAGGSRFAFAIDVQRSTVPVEPLSRPCVLIAEQDVAVGHMLETMVAESGYAAERVDTAQAVRDALARRGFAALLLGFGRNDENGIAFVQALRAAERTPALPIVVMSTVGDMSAEDRVPFDLVDWLVKPVDPVRLGEAIYRAAGRSGKPCPTILHVDDDSDASALTGIPRYRDARVLTAADLATARALLETEHPDIVILDWPCDGSAVSDLPTPIAADGLAIPTIVLSAHRTAPERVDPVLVKPRDTVPDLGATVRRILETRHSA